MMHVYQGNDELLMHRHKKNRHRQLAVAYTDFLYYANLLFYQLIGICVREYNRFA